MEFTLPCGFKHDGKHIKTGVLSEMTGWEEDILVSGGSKGTSVMNQILGRCLEKLGDLSIPAKLDSDRAKRAKAFAPLLDKMLMNDRSFLYIMLRKASLGPDFYFEGTCPRCNAIQPRLRANLDELKVTEMREAEKEGSKEQPPLRAPLDENELILPSGKVLKWRHLVGGDEQYLSQLRTEKSSDFISGILYRRALTIDSDAVTSLAQIKGLSSRDRDAFRGEIDRVEGGIETEITIDCAACGHSWNIELPVTQKSFFFPSGVR